MLSDLTSSYLGIFLLVLALVVAVLWVFLPLAVFGIKAKLDTLIAEQRAAGEQYRLAIAEIRQLGAASDRPAVNRGQPSA